MQERSKTGIVSRKTFPHMCRSGAILPSQTSGLSQSARVCLLCQHSTGVRTMMGPAMRHRIALQFILLYILLQIDPSSLIAASVMAAPCALAMAKLVYPEVEESKFQSREGVTIACG